MYHISVQRGEKYTSDDEDIRGYVRTKRNAIRFIADETGASLREVAPNVSAKDDSDFRCNGWHVQVFYVTAD